MLSPCGLVARSPGKVQVYTFSVFILKLCTGCVHKIENKMKCVQVLCTKWKIIQNVYKAMLRHWVDCLCDLTLLHEKNSRWSIANGRLSFRDHEYLAAWRVALRVLFGLKNHMAFLQYICLLLLHLNTINTLRYDYHYIRTIRGRRTELPRKI